MILFWIIVALFAITTIWWTIAMADDFTPWHRYNTNFWDYVKSFFVMGFISGILWGFVLVVSQMIAGAVQLRSEEVTYSQPLASLKDGTGVEGQFYGGLFMRRGYIQDTQVFSYYRVVAPNQYVLEKRNADQSTIWTDATNETARVDITDRVFSYEPAWYLMGAPKKGNEFVHANFHVPAGSVEQTFELDAQ